MAAADEEAELASLEATFSRGAPDSNSEAQESKGRKRRSDAGQPRKTGPRAPSQAKLVEELLAPWASAAALIAPPCPTVATVMAAEGEKTIKAFVTIASQYPKFYAGLQKAAQIGPAATVAQTFMTILIALMLDTRRITPEHPVAGVTGLAALTRQTHPEWYIDQSAQSPIYNMAPSGYPPGYKVAG